MEGQLWKEERRRRESKEGTRPTFYKLTYFIIVFNGASKITYVRARRPFGVIRDNVKMLLEK
jgi:hypothetical protein